MTSQIEGVAHVIKQLTDLQQTPNLDSPHYIVLKKTKEYEVRQYSPYLVAETSMPTGTRPAGGDGFNNLAGYIFGGNSRSTYPSPATCFTCSHCAFHAALLMHTFNFTFSQSVHWAYSFAVLVLCFLEQQV